MKWAYIRQEGGWYNTTDDISTRRDLSDNFSFGQPIKIQWIHLPQMKRQRRTIPKTAIFVLFWFLWTREVVSGFALADRNDPSSLTQRRRGRLPSLLHPPPSSLSAAKTTKNDDSYGTISQKKAEQSIQSCLWMALASATVDFLTLGAPALVALATAIQSPEATLVALQHTLPTLKLLLAPAAVLWKLGFAQGLQSQLQTVHRQDFDQLSWNQVRQVYQTMGHLWRQATILLVLQSSVALGSVLSETNWGWPAWVVTGALGMSTVVVGVVLLWMHVQESRVIADLKDMLPAALPAKKVGLRGANAMAICTAVLLWDGWVKAVVACAQDTWLARGLQLSGVPTSFGVAFLVWKLRRSNLQALESGLKASTIREIPAETRSTLFQSQADFFGEVKSVFKSDAISKLVLEVVQFIRILMLS